VEQSPAVSTAEVLSQSLGVVAMTASELEKGGTSTAPPIGGHQDELCVSDLPPTLGQQAAEVGGTSVEGDDNNKFLYVRIPWEDDIIADRRDVDVFKEALRTTARTLSVRSLTCLSDLCCLV
jgi:hypothetical protein